MEVTKMESIFTYGLRKIKEEIPREILTEVFNSQKYLGMALRTPITIDEEIEQKVIRGGVVKDIIPMGGRETRVPLGGAPVRFLPNMRVMVQVPLELTQGRNIIEVYRVNFFTNTAYQGHAGNTLYANSGAVNLALNNILDSSTAPPIVSTSRCQMVTPNVVLIDLNGMVPLWMELEVLLEKDNELSHITPSSFDAFGQLCVERAKQYVYHNQIIPTDEGRLMGGKELSLIDSYQDASRNYRDLLKSWKTVETLNDPAEMEKLVRLMVGNFSV
jgi:hypothetical protein